MQIFWTKHQTPKELAQPQGIVFSFFNLGRVCTILQSMYVILQIIFAGKKLEQQVCSSVIGYLFKAYFAQPELKHDKI